MIRIRWGPRIRPSPYLRYFSIKYRETKRFLLSASLVTFFSSSFVSVLSSSFVSSRRRLKTIGTTYRSSLYIILTNFIPKKNCGKRCAITEKKNTCTAPPQSSRIDHGKTHGEIADEMEYKGANYTLYSRRKYTKYKNISHICAHRILVSQLNNSEETGREYNAPNEFYPVLNFITIVAYRILTVFVAINEQKSKWLRRNDTHGRLSPLSQLFSYIFFSFFSFYRLLSLSLSLSYFTYFD